MNPLNILLTAEQVNKAVNHVIKLPPYQRGVIIAALNGVSPVEYAEITGKNWNTVKAVYTEGCKNLRKAIES